MRYTCRCCDLSASYGRKEDVPKACPKCGVGLSLQAEQVIYPKAAAPMFYPKSDFGETTSPEDTE